MTLKQCRSYRSSIQQQLTVQIMQLELEGRSGSSESGDENQSLSLVDFESMAVLKPNNEHAVGAGWNEWKLR